MRIQQPVDCPAKDSSISHGELEVEDSLAMVAPCGGDHPNHSSPIKNHGKFTRSISAYDKDEDTHHMWSSTMARLL